MAVAVYPERMDQIDTEDVEASLRTMETYIHYICERTEFALTNTFRTTNDLGETTEDLTKVVETARGEVEALGGRVTDLSNDLDGKVDKEDGKGLSSNDYTNDDKDKLAGIDADAEANVIETVKVNGTALMPDGNKAVDVTVPAKVSDLTNDSGFLTQETDPTVPAWAKAASKPSYTAQEVGALPGNTVIPSKTSDLANDSGYQTAAQVQAAAETAVSGVLSEVSLFDLTPAVFTVHQENISIQTGSNLRTANLRGNYVESFGHDLGGSTFRSLVLTSGRATTQSTTGSSFTLYKSEFKPVPAASNRKLLLTVRRFRADVGNSASPPQIYVATYDADGKIWWANVIATVLGYYRQRYVVDPQVFSNGNLCVFVQFRKPTHTFQASFDLDVVAADAPVSAPDTSFSALTDSGFTAQDQT